MGQIFLTVSDDCVGVWCVPSATYVPCTHQSQNTVLGIGLFVTSVVETLQTIDTKPWNCDSSGKETRMVSVAAFFMCLYRRFCIQHNIRKRKKVMSFKCN